MPQEVTIDRRELPLYDKDVGVAYDKDRSDESY